jgi:hypothetical protein
MARLALLTACLLAALAAVSAASAGDVQIVRAVDAARPETQAFSPDVAVTVESPGPYVAGSPGTWTGPSFGTGPLNAAAGTARIDWAVTFRDRAADPPAAAAAANTNDWPLDQKFNLSIPLFVAGRLVGTIPAYAVVTQAGGAQKARFEATAAIPLGPGAQALVHFSTPAPNTDDYTVAPGILASTWNRGEILQAMSLIRLEGNQAPKLLSIRVDRAARAVRGKVVDAFYNPLVGAAVVEQRWNGKAWKTSRIGHTAKDGTYRMPAGTGRFRTVVTVNGTSLTSAEVSI